MYGSNSLENNIRQKRVAFEEELCHEYETCIMNMGILHHEYKKGLHFESYFFGNILRGLM